MANDVSEIYSREIYDNLRPLYGNWEPSQPLELGDYGKLNDRVFIRLGAIKDLGIEFKKLKNDKLQHKFFASKKGLSLKFTEAGSAVAGAAVNAKAAIEIAFSNERAVFFNAAGCSYSMIADKVALGNEVMKRFQKDKWDRSWVVVTDLIHSGLTTIAVSGGGTSKIVFEAKGDVPKVELANASVGLTLNSAESIGYQITAEKGLTPLLGLAGIKRRFLLAGDAFDPLALSSSDTPSLDSHSPAPDRSNQPSEELIFSQLD